MMLELIKDLKQTGLLPKLYKAGLISHKVGKYWDIYMTVQAELGKGNVDKMVAYQFAADQHSVCINTVINAVRFLES